MDRVPLVAIVGAGFSGAVAAVHLLRDARLAPARVVLIERPGRGVGGVAYDVDSDHLLLNVPAQRMSAFEDAPNDFLAFLRSRDPATEPGRYARRRDYGEYLASRLDAATRAALDRDGPRVVPERIAGVVQGLQRDALGRLRLRVDSGEGPLELAPDAVLLATGNVAPQPPRWLQPWMQSEGLYAEAWSPGALAAAPGDGTIVLLGTGLTTVDLVIELRARGYTGRMVAISRHGLLPRVDHGPAPPPQPGDLPALLDGDGPLRAVALVHALHAQANALADRGRDWRSLVAAARARVPELWARLDPRERARFLRHARIYWETHRHRMPATLASQVGAEIRAGRLEVVAGRVLGARRGDDGRGLLLQVQDRGGTSRREVAASRVLNCTGAAAGAPLPGPWPALLEQGLAARDALGLGVLTDERGRLLSADGAPQPGLYYAGPMWRAQHWEMTAVPELRQRLPRVAAAIADDVIAGAAAGIAHPAPVA
jgi:uncharacterized NAD(P)/FAD-binding protein YdhS